MKTVVALCLMFSAISYGEGVQPKTIPISAKKFEYTPSVIELKKGEPVILELTTQDRKHGFRVKSLGIDVQIKPGEVTRVPLTPTQAGEFKFQCSVFCGSKHEDMAGKIVVKD